MPEQLIADDAIARRNEPLTIEEQGSGFHAVLAGSAGRVLVTNDIGCLVLGLCDGTQSRDAIVSAMVAKFPNVPAERVTTDVRSFLDQATDKEVITWNQ